MKIVKFKKGETIVDDEDYEFVVNLFKDSCVYMNNGYVRMSVGHPRRETSLHRIILGLEKEDKDLVADHINGIRNDNRRENLRVATHAQNIQHKTITKNGKYRNIYRHNKTNKKGLWRYIVQLQFNGKNYYGGYFYSMDSAISAAAALRKKVFGKFA